MSKKHIDR